MILGLVGMVAAISSAPTEDTPHHGGRPWAWMPASPGRRRWRPTSPQADGRLVSCLVVVGLACVLLTLTFRRLLTPPKGVTGSLLRVLATFGVTVAVFRSGQLSDAPGASCARPVVALAPRCVSTGCVTPPCGQSPRARSAPRRRPHARDACRTTRRRALRSLPRRAV